MKAIASARLYIGSAKTPRRRVEFIVFTPEPDPKSKNGDYRCKVHAKGIARPRWVYGLDSLQALGLSFRLIKLYVEVLNSKGLSLYHSKDCEEPSEFIFSYFGDMRDAPTSLIKKTKRIN